MKVSVFALCWNEVLLIPFVTKWWKDRFPEVELNLLDNESNDGSQQLAENLGWKVHTFSTGGNFRDDVNMYLKNTCWKDCPNDWIVVCDMDEVLQLTEGELVKMNNEGVTLPFIQGWEMIGLKDTIDLESMKYGVKNSRYSKNIIFNKSKVSPNYTAGSHEIYPSGEVKFSKNVVKLLHFKHLCPDYLVNRYKILGDRVDAYNLSLGHAKHYSLSEQYLRDEFEQLKKKAIKIIN